MLLGHVGESDFGLLQFSRGRPKLQKLELRGCCFSEHALALAALQLASLRYLGFKATMPHQMAMIFRGCSAPYWNIEFIPQRRRVFMLRMMASKLKVVHQAQILAYHSLPGPRTDCPDTVIPLIPMRGVYT